jgi:branched-chain amino acid transport system substrate-binding protein
MFTRQKVNRIVWVSFVLTLTLLFYSNASYPQTTPKKKWVTFGVICPRTGPVAEVGEYIIRGTELAVEEVNTKWNPPDGGLIIKGERYYVKYEPYDDEADPSKTVAGFRKLVEMYHVPFINGPLGTPHSWAVMPVSKELKTGFISYSASDKTHRMGNPYVVLCRVPNQYFGIPMAKACIDRGWKKFAVCSDVSDAWLSLAKEFRAEMERLGGTCVGFEVVDTKTIFDYRSIMTGFKAKNADVIFVNAYPEPIGIMVSHAREVGYKGQFIACNNFTQIAIKFAGLENSVGTLVETFYSTYCLSHPEADKNGAVTYLSNIFKKKYPGVPFHDLVSDTWTAVLTWLKGMEVAGTATDSPPIRKALNEATKLIQGQITYPRDGILPSGQLTGAIEFLCEVQRDGSFKKVGEMTIPTEKLREYPIDAPSK